MKTIEKTLTITLGRFQEKKTVHTTIFAAYIGYGYTIFKLIDEPSNLLIVMSFLTLFVGYFIGIQIGHLSGAFTNG